jgi:hypothetical protein
MNVAQGKNGFIKRPYNTANLNFPSPKLICDYFKISKKISKAFLLSVDLLNKQSTSCSKKSVTKLNHWLTNITVNKDTVPL